MTETRSQRDDLVEAITRQVLAAFGGGAGAGGAALEYLAASSGGRSLVPSHSG